MAHVISLFNHKGGVSKTTTVYHLGWKLASKGKKVLIVDADPQCNLTGLTLGLDDYEALRKFYENKNNTDIFNSLAPVFSLDNGYKLSSEKTTITKTKNDNLYILAGNIRFSELDTQIATALTSSTTLPVLRQFVGAFNNLIRKISEEHNIDYVIVDMSPSVSATNQCILMSSDYFIVPISPDFYCYQAIDSLSNVLPRWVKDIDSFKHGTDSPLPEKSPKMLGFITQNYRIYTTDSLDSETPKRMSKAYSEWLDRIKNVSNKKLIPSLSKENMVIDSDIFKESCNYDAPFHLAGVQNFSGLTPVSQSLSKPIFELTKEDGNWTGARWVHMKNNKEYGIKVNIEDADRVYDKLADSVMNMIRMDVNKV
ncbi:TPA: ParA family protein [Morganella morganii]|uniref:ParA family protein n=1 Tax=Morganella morganii TaxID=582 RepID=UPI0032DAA3D9